MRVFISVDMEGVAGVNTLDQIVRGGAGYPDARRLMTEEANAAIRGAFDSGATTVVVNDSHGTMDNFVTELLDPRARVVSGAPRASCMVQGLSAADDLAVFIGYHAPAGAEGVLAHTYSSNFTELRVDGVPMSEADVNGLYAASFGVPLGVLSGDDEICRAARANFPGVIDVAVKQAHGFQSAENVSPDAARTAIRSAVATAVQAPPAPRPSPVGPFRLGVDFTVPLHADYAATVPGSERVGGRTLEREVADVAELMNLIMAWYYLASLGAAQFAAIAHRR